MFATDGPLGQVVNNTDHYKPKSCAQFFSTIIVGGFMCAYTAGFVVGYNKVASEPSNAMQRLLNRKKKHPRGGGMDECVYIGSIA